MKKQIPTPVIVTVVVTIIVIVAFFLLKGIDNRDPSAVQPGDYSKDPTTERKKMQAAKDAEAAKAKNP